jgi:hypothetical protein
MPPLEPKKPVGSLSSGLSMKVVICPSCKKKRWANAMKKQGEYRTTCCGITVT